MSGSMVIVIDFMNTKKVRKVMKIKKMKVTIKVEEKLS
jgi:hypothetical protein